MEEKVCKTCKAFYIGDKCPICGSTARATAWYGKLIILEPQKSMIANALNIKKAASYALKVR